MEMEIGPLFSLWIQSALIGIISWVLTICIFVIVYGRMIEVYLVTSIAPIPMATMGNREWSSMGQNYLRSLFALGFQAFLPFLDKYKPQYLLHGHVHLRYSQDRTRERVYGDTQVINVGERYVLDIPDREVPPDKQHRLIWAKKIKEDDFYY